MAKGRVVVPGGKYNVGDYIESTSLEQMLMILSGEQAFWHSGIQFMYSKSTSSINTMKRRNPINNDVIWTAELKASDGYGASGFNPLCLVSSGYLIGSGGERSTMSEQLTYLTPSGSFVKGALFSGDSAKPYINTIGRFWNSNYIGGYDFLCRIYNAGSTYDGIRRVSFTTLGWKLNSNIGTPSYAQIDRIRNHLLCFHWDGGTNNWVIYRYNLSSGLLVDTWNTGVSASASTPFYFDFDPDYVYFSFNGNGQVTKHSLDTKTTVTQVTTEFKLCNFLGEYDSAHFLCQETYSSATDKYRVYKVPKSTLTSRIDAQVLSSKLVNEGTYLNSPIVSKENAAVYTALGKFGIDNLGVKIIA